MKKLHLKTQELTFFQKLLQVYWGNPKSWLLEEFILKKKKITIIRKDGHVFKARIDEIEAKYQTDRYDRREVWVKNVITGEKTRFKEIGWMLTDDEWDLVMYILSAKQTKLSKFLNGALEVLNLAKDIKSAR